MSRGGELGIQLVANRSAGLPVMSRGGELGIQFSGKQQCRDVC